LHGKTNTKYIVWLAGCNDNESLLYIEPLKG